MNLFFFVGESMLPLAPPSFIGDPSAPVKQIDPYGKINPEVQTNIASKLTAFDLSFDSILAKSVDMTKRIGATLADGSLSLPEAKRRLQDAMGGSRQGISALAEGLENLMLGDMTGKDPGTGYVRTANDMIDGVQLVINGKKSTFTKGDFPNVGAIVGFIGDLSNNPLINAFDLGAEAALVKGILTQVTQWGVPEIIDETFGAKWDDTNKRYNYDYDADFRFSVVKRTSEDLSPGTDLATIRQLMLHGGDTALIAANPSFPEQLLEQYNFPLGIVPSKDDKRPDLHTYGEELKLLEEILDILKPDWYQIKRMVFDPAGNPAYKPELVWNLRFISKASIDAVKLISYDTKYIPALLTAPFYSVDSGKQLLTRMYPYIVLQ
ncbi:hypothetical protein PHABIO_249 [Pseudomonas phage Phabio]|uniref:Uncharacterized protein n=1 Tax=Pseudomonas phage Phabio TaxID=2006668 RepID=A0A1Y0SU69_9CAUD|nr:hypothetical protein MZD05_gp249 [Pseudomonas phage Phabio]ARV76880.1 hypothetical protein PHABIO_249 [Pseudomonas phage Phabio]